MEGIKNLLQRAGQASPEHLAAAVVDAVQSGIREVLPNDQTYLQANSVKIDTVTVRASHAAAAGHLNIHAAAVLQRANQLLQKRFPGQPQLTEIRIVRN